MAFIKDGIQFVQEAIIELKKVSWPGRKEVIAATIVVIILVVLVAMYVGSIDFILSTVLALILR